MPGDPRSKDSVYKQERIPKARFFDCDVVADKSVDIAHMLPKLEEFEQHMAIMDVTGKDDLVFYDDEGAIGACRALWTFDVFGAPSIHLLNGGLPIWKAKSQPTEKGEEMWKEQDSEKHPSGTFTYNKELVKDMKQIRDWVAKSNKDFELVDARPERRFKGLDPDPRGRSTHFSSRSKLYGYV